MKLSKDKLSGHIIFLKGLPGSGKTSIAKKIKEILIKNKISNIHLDGDDLRLVLNNKKYLKKDRIQLSRTYLNLAELLIKQTDVVILSSVSLFNEIENFIKRRKKIRSYLIEKNFTKLDKKKMIIRKKYLKTFNAYKYQNKKNIVKNKSVSKSAELILSNFF
jgi:adenylylsulfate kinase-like enzyme